MATKKEDLRQGAAALITPLETDLVAYEKELPGLLPEHEGQFVLLRGGNVVGFWPTEEEAVTEGDRLFGRSPFLVKKVEKEEKPLPTFTPLITRCRPSSSH